MLLWYLCFYWARKLPKCPKLTILGYTKINFYKKIIFFQFLFNNLKERLILSRIPIGLKNTLKQQSYIEF